MGRFKPFAACVFPAVFAFALSGIYAIVDGFFVGRSIGDTGLSAINIAYPVTALIQAAGTGTGMGGAVMYSVRLAEKRDSEAENFMKGVFFYLALTGILLTVILFPLTDPLLSLMGADGELMKPGREYLSVIVLGSVFQVFGTGVVPLIRNQGKSVQAMYCMIGGFVTNIFLDYLFVWVLRLGMAGAAWASVAGQAVTMAGGLLCMRGQKIPVGIPRQALSVFFSIWRIGLAPFGITMCPMISLLLMNRASLQYGGSEGVACYACIAYVITIMYLILQGVGDGSQPLMSRFYGEDNKKRSALRGPWRMQQPPSWEWRWQCFCIGAETGSEFCLEHPKPYLWQLERICIYFWRRCRFWPFCELQLPAFTPQNRPDFPI